MKLYRLVVLCFLLLVGSASAKPHPGVDYVKTSVQGVPLHLVDIDIKRSDLIVRPVVAPSGQRRTFQQMVKDTRPVAAINGTFFDTKTGVTVGNLVSEGRLLSEGMMGSNLVFNKDGSIQLLSSSRNLGRYTDWSNVDFAVGGGPTLLTSGEYFVDPASEGFRDPSLFHARPRAALGVTGDGRLRMVVVTQGVTLWKLAHIMKELRCVHALNLDGGTSAGLSVGGTTMVNPGRKLTNIVGVYAAHLGPPLSRAKQVAATRAVGHFQKAQQYLKSGELRLARSQMRQAVAKAPEQAGFWKAAGQIEARVGNASQAAGDFLRAASLYKDRGDLAAATELAEKVIALEAKSPSAHLILGECKAELLDDRQALYHLEIVLESLPGHPRATEILRDVRFRLQSQKAVESSGATIVETLSAFPKR